MGGLREKRKNETNEKILSVSREIFFSKGYADTTIEEIAERAGIAVGTVYNFFRTKADILIAVVAKEADAEEWDFKPEPSDLEQGVVELVLRFTWRSYGKLKFLSKKVWRDLTSAMLRPGNQLFRGLSSLDFQYIRKLRELLETLRTQSVLPRDFDTDSAAMVVYGIFLTQFLLFIYSDDTTFEQMEQAIRRQVGFAFAGKFAGQEQGA